MKTPRPTSSNYIIYELHHHWLEYLILLIGLAVAASLFVFFWPNRDTLRLIIIGLGVFYFIWGVATHMKAQRINTRVVSEYFMVSLLACGLLYLLII